ncbi:kelch-like protein 21 isoform X1 [Branchiostoma floridae]|uniref:Kelch-like protein 21 isoform X1 n=2 Tax=Branchiostoma floridae TaxID=7739 RepID=A0A9J7MAD6_BRAFL|nr:kelch-like protein 21 isoform X1 [Branchiostoma floridae]
MSGRLNLQALHEPNPGPMQSAQSSPLFSAGRRRRRILSDSVELPFCDSFHASNVLRGLWEIRTEGKFCDLALLVGTKEFFCHRNVLAAASSYFRAMFLSDLRESKQDKVILKEVSPNIMQLLIDYAYTGRVLITEQNVEALLPAANLFQFPAVRDACCQFLERQLDPTNCIGIHKFAETHHCKELAETSKAFVLDHFLDVCQSREFLALDKKFVVDYISSANLRVMKERVYEAVMSWVKYSVQRRATALPELLGHVKLPFIAQHYFVTKIETEPLIVNSPRCIKVLQYTRNYHIFNNDPNSRPKFFMKPGRGREGTKQEVQEVMLVVGGCDGFFHYISNVDMFDPENHMWSPLAELPDAEKRDLSVVSLGTEVYVTGGSDGKNVFPDTWRYSSQFDEWVKVAPMLTARHRHGTAVLGGHIYAVGGHDEASALSDVERYDPFSNEWHAAPPMPKAMEDFTLSAHGSNMYVIGSAPESETLELQIFNHKTQSWNLEAPPSMPAHKYCLQSVCLDGLIYLIGADSREMYVFDPARSEWNPAASMIEEHGNGTIGAVSGKIYVSGGYFTDITECYDPEGDAWTNVGTVPQLRCYSGCVTIVKPNFIEWPELET